MIFSTGNSFNRYEELGIVKLLAQKADNGVNTTVLVKNDDDDDKNSNIERNMKDLMSKHPASNLKIRYFKSVKTKVTTFLADNDLSLVIELKGDDTKAISNGEEAVGLATYSNSESTVLSNASIFETLWLSQSNVPILPL